MYFRDDHPYYHVVVILCNIIILYIYIICISLRIQNIFIEYFQKSSLYTLSPFY